MKQKYVIGELVESRLVNVNGHKGELDMKWAEGMIGVLPVFSLKGFARKYNKKAIC